MRRGDDSDESLWNKLEKPNGEETAFSASKLAMDSCVTVRRVSAHDLEFIVSYGLLDCVVLQTELLDLICNANSVANFLDSNLFQHGLIQLHQILAVDVMHWAWSAW